MLNYLLLGKKGDRIALRLKKMAVWAKCRGKVTIPQLTCLADGSTLDRKKTLEARGATEGKGHERRVEEDFVRSVRGSSHALHAVHHD